MAEADLDYNTGTESSVLDDNNTADVDHSNVSILVRHLKDVDRWIAEHNTFDVINPKSNLTVEQQVAAHKALVAYLRTFKTELKEKIKELTNGR